MSSLKTKFAASAAKTLRANLTDAEAKLWSKLRNRRLAGCKFVRQQPIGPYIADFACRERDLIVELDGGQHAESAKDIERTRVLGEHGYVVIRFWNRDVLTNLDGVLQTIADRLEKAPSPGATRRPLPRGRGEGVSNRELTGETE